MGGPGCKRLDAIMPHPNIYVTHILKFPDVYGFTKICENLAHAKNSRYQALIPPRKRAPRAYKGLGTRLGTRLTLCQAIADMGVVPVVAPRAVFNNEGTWGGLWSLLNEWGGGFAVVITKRGLPPPDDNINRGHGELAGK